MKILITDDDGNVFATHNDLKDTKVSMVRMLLNEQTDALMAEVIEDVHAYQQRLLKNGVCSGTTGCVSGCLHSHANLRR